MNGPMAQQTVSLCLKEVTDALNAPHILKKYIKLPLTINERNLIKRQFYDKYGLSGVIGCIDCTHIAIVRPSLNEERYFNRKHFHSINAQVICDNTSYITNVDASYGGATHEAYIWSQSDIRCHMEGLHSETVYLLEKSRKTASRERAISNEDVHENCSTGSSGTVSPLPELIVEFEKPVYQVDESPEEKKRIHKKIMKFYLRYMINGEDISTVSTDISDPEDIGELDSTDHIAQAITTNDVANKFASVGQEITAGELDSTDHIAQAITTNDVANKFASVGQEITAGELDSTDHIAQAITTNDVANKFASVGQEITADKNIQKRPRMEPTEDEDMSKVTALHRMKKMKIMPVTTVTEFRKKMLEADDQQRQARKQHNDKISKDLAEITSQVEANYNVMEGNENKLAQLTGAFMKCIQQSKAVFKQNLGALRDIQLVHQQIEEKESEQKEETGQLMDEIDIFINNMRDKMNKEIKRKSLDHMRKILTEMKRDM